jgi:hypothetical protein
MQARMTDVYFAGKTGLIRSPKLRRGLVPFSTAEADAAAADIAAGGDFSGESLEEDHHLQGAGGSSRALGIGRLDGLPATQEAAAAAAAAAVAVLPNLGASIGPQVQPWTLRVHPRQGKAAAAAAGLASRFRRRRAGQLARPAVAVRLPYGVGSLPSSPRPSGPIRE